MYSGTINISNPDDLNVLKQQASLIASINTQLEKFSSFRTNIDDVYKIIREGTPLFSNVASAIKKAASALGEYNVISQFGATLMSKLSTNTALYSAVTKVATVAKEAFNKVVHLSSLEITALIVAITAVVAAITTFVKWINRTNETGEAAKTSAENLVAAQEELSQSAIDSSAAYVTGSFYK